MKKIIITYLILNSFLGSAPALSKTITSAQNPEVIEFNMNTPQKQNSLPDKSNNFLETAYNFDNTSRSDSQLNGIWAKPDMVKIDVPADMPTNVLKSTISSSRNFNKDGQFWQRTWTTLKGKPTEDALLLGMFSYHTRSDRDELNESNKLGAIDYNGYTLGTFNNSYHTQTYYVGLSRKIYEQQLPGDVDFKLKYKLVALHGYEREEPDIAGITPTVIPMIGFTKGYIGVDFLASPGRTVTFATNFRINLKDNKNQKNPANIK